MNATTPAIADLVARANALAGQGRLADADALFTRVLATDAAQPAALRFKAALALQRQQYPVAEDLLRSLLEREPDDASCHFNLALALYGQERHEQALAALDACVARNPEHPPAWLYRGALLEDFGREDEAVVSFLRGIRSAGRLGVQPSDEGLQRLTAHATAAVAVALDRAIDAALAPLVARHGADAIARIRKGADMFVGKRPIEFAHPLWRPGLFYVPDLEPRMFFAREEFPWAAEVEAATAEVRAELEAVLADGEGLKPYVNHAAGTAGARTWQGINQSADWSSFHFFRHGERYEDNCRRCPRTAALLESIDLHRVPGYGPEAMFSVLRPHTRIPPHHGPVNGRVVVHLPLIVPPDCGALKAGDQQQSWQEGRLMMFDDAFRHEAWNDSDETRVVLIFDVWNPLLEPHERALVTAATAALAEFNPGELHNTDF